jgi:hypothetical protein
MLSFLRFEFLADHIPDEESWPVEIYSRKIKLRPLKRDYPMDNTPFAEPHIARGTLGTP